MFNISSGNTHDFLGQSRSVLDEVPHSPATRVSTYAKCEDFRKVFAENLDSLYQLALLLTNDAQTAEQCLIDALDECVRSQQVFKEWALCWAKRALIQTTVRTMRPTPGGAHLPFKVSDATGAPPTNDEGAGFNLVAVLSLGNFERFVFVLCVLDNYSDRDCASLLRCDLEDLRRARISAFRQLALSTYSIASDEIPTNRLAINRPSC